MKNREFTSQMISPPIVLNLSMQEEELLKTYMEQFTRIGFEIEEFGQESYAVRAVPEGVRGAGLRAAARPLRRRYAGGVCQRRPRDPDPGYGSADGHTQKINQFIVTSYELKVICKHRQ